MRHRRATVSPRRSLVRSLASACVLALFGVVMIAPGSMSAHARLVSSSPASGTALPAMPIEFTLDFSEEIDPGFSSASLLRSDEESVPLGPLATTDNRRTLIVPIVEPDTVPPGTYTLVWRALSAADGHVTTGTVAFSVGTGVAPEAAGGSELRPPWWRVALRWLELAGLALAAGAFLFAFLIVRKPIAGLPLQVRAFGRVVLLATAVVILLSTYDLGISATGTGFFDPPGIAAFRDLLLDSRGGRALLVVAVCATVMLILLSTTSRRSSVTAIGTAAGLLALLAVAASGHAAAASPSWRAILVDWLHYAAVACWFGTLPYLWVTLRTTGTIEASTLLLSRFSRFGLALIGGIFVSGIVRASLEVSGPRTLVETDYGRTLILKHLLVVPILIAAGVNRLALVPHLRRSISPATMLTIRRFVSIELSAAALVLLAAAALTELAPANAPLPVDVATRPVTIDQQARVGNLGLWLLARLTGAANDRYTITVNSLDGGPPADLQRVIVESRTNVDGTEVGDRFDAESLSGSPGTYVFPAVRLGLPGLWDLNIIARRAGLEDVSSTFSVDTTSAGVRPPELVEDDWRLPRMTIPAWLFGLLALAALIGGVVAVRTLRTIEPFAAAILLTMTALITSGFAVQGYRQTVPVSAGTDLANPVPLDAASIQRGADLYWSLCMACHGQDAAGLPSDDPVHGHSGANLLDRRTTSQRDGDLYWSVTEGVGGTEMPSYDQALTEEERWDLVNYLRSLEDSSANS